MKGTKEHTLTNPLSKDERLSIIRLLGHDAKGELQLLSGMMEGVQAKKETRYLSDVMSHPEHISTTLQAVDILGLREKINLFDGCNATSFDDSRELSRKIRVMNSVLHNKIDISTATKLYLKIGLGIGPFLSPVAVTYSVLFNLAKNAILPQNNENPERKPLLSLGISNGFPEDTLWVPEGARNHERFVRFTITNQGEFPRDKPLLERLTGQEPPRNGKGYGLYFTGLASRFLQSPIDIKSEKRQTRVDFYHPIYA